MHDPAIKLLPLGDHCVSLEDILAFLNLNLSHHGSRLEIFSLFPEPEHPPNELLNISVKEEKVKAVKIDHWI